MAFTPITVTRRYVTADLEPAQGKVRFTPQVQMVNGDTVAAAPVEAVLDAEGDIVVELAANNDPATLPAGTTYQVWEELAGQARRVYNVVIPFNAPGGTVDLGSLTPLVSPSTPGMPIAGVVGLRTELDAAEAALATTQAALSAVTGRVVRGIPSEVITRTGDQTLVAGTAYGQPVDVPVTTRVRRARTRLSAAVGDLSIGVYDAARTRKVTTGAVNGGPAGVYEVGMPPTDISPGPASLWLSASGALGVGGNGAQGDICACESATSAHPLPTALTGVAAQSIGLAVQVLPNDPTPLTSGYVYSRTTMPVSCLGKIGSKLYGRNTSTDKWATSTDNGATWTDQTGPAFITAFGATSILQLIGHSTYMIAIDATGDLWRATLDDFSAWTSIKGGWRAGTTGRVGEISSNGTNLIYGNYNGDTVPWTSAQVWLSTNNGGTWTAALTVAGARHTHAVAFDPVTATTAWATVGDDVASGAGLYKSTDSGANWTLVSSNRYGIDIAFAYSMVGAVSRVILEGDGTLAPHIFQYPISLAAGARQDPTIWPDLSPVGGGGSWGGTARAVCVTTEGNLIYASSSENTVAPNNYTRNGLWIARGPWFTSPVLLEEFSTFAATPAWRKTYESNGWLLNGVNRIPKPKFAGQ